MGLVHDLLKESGVSLKVGRWSKKTRGRDFKVGFENPFIMCSSVFSRLDMVYIVNKKTMLHPITL